MRPALLIGFVLIYQFVFVSPVFAAIVLNEISPTGETEWIELFNTGGEPVDLEDWMIKDGNTKPSDDLTLQGLIPPNSHLVFSRGKGWLNDSGDETVYLYTNTDSSNSVDKFSFQGTSSTKTYSRIPDGTGQFVANTDPTPNSFNAPPPTPTPTPTPTPSPSPTPTPSPTPSPTKTPTSIPTPTKTAIPTPTAVLTTKTSTSTTPSLPPPSQGEEECDSLPCEVIDPVYPHGREGRGGVSPILEPTNSPTVSPSGEVLSENITVKPSKSDKVTIIAAIISLTCFLLFMARKLQIIHRLRRRQEE